MSTDPFVAPRLDDAPRHRQNLPAGVAYPPARRPSGPRPGDLGSGQPTGPLLGSPGPNVGYARRLAERAASQFLLAPHEDAGDAAVVVAEIAMKRAACFGRAPAKGDVEIAIVLLGYDGSATSDFTEWRVRAVREADHHYAGRRRIIDLAGDELLRRSPNEIAARVADWRRIVLSRSSAE